MPPLLRREQSVAVAVRGRDQARLPGLPETRWRQIMHEVNQVVNMVVNLKTNQDPSRW